MAPLHRGIAGMRLSDVGRDASGDDSQMKDPVDKEEAGGGVRPARSLSAVDSPSSPAPFRFLAKTALPVYYYSKSGLAENGYGSAESPMAAASARTRLNLTLYLLKLSLVIIVLLAFSWSVWWTISISNSSNGNVYKGYRRLQEQLITDLADIGVLSLGLAKLKEVELCSPELENYVPCFNVSDAADLDVVESVEYDRACSRVSSLGCLVLPPKNYKIPLRWPTGKDVIWYSNVKITAQEVLSSGIWTRRMMMLEEDQVSFHSDSVMVDGVEDYSHQIAEMIGLRNESYFNQAGVRSVLDIGCGYGSFGAHLYSKQLLTMCIASYELSGSQVQLTLERGLPAMIGSVTAKQLPCPSLSFDMVHCARCGVEWQKKGGIYLLEVDRLLRPGGYFIWTSPVTNNQRSLRNKEYQKTWKFVREFTENICWELLSQQDETVVWKKTTKKSCYSSRKSGEVSPVCGKGHYVESPHYRQLESCISGTQSQRWIPIEARTIWPSQARLNSSELKLHGVYPDDFGEDDVNWKTAIRNYWSLLSPLIFSDHPKRPGDEDPIPPFNMLRNVMDMNTHFGGFNAALLDAGKSVWVMNVVPTSGPNHLPLIMDRGFVGVLHDWCEAFPTYPRTYDMLHAEGLLSLEFAQSRRCTLLDLFLEMDRILRPEGWVIMRDTAVLIETARALATQLRWDARVVETENNSDESLLICQKPFTKKL